MKCPGQDRRYFKPEDVYELACEGCGRAVEFFKDDAVRRCPQCGRRMVNPKVSQGCAQWCSHARECLGYDPKAAGGAGEAGASLADRLIEAVKFEFGTDQKRITHALLVLEHAEAILRQEGGDPRVVVAAALLHDIGIQVAERQYGSAAGRYQEIAGPPIARRILEKLGFDEATIVRTCEIIAHHHSKGIDSIEFRILWDADNLINLQRELAEADADRRRTIAEDIFLTKTGKERAERPSGQGPLESKQ
jgi:HD superfamily phosphodiesterase